MPYYKDNGKGEKSMANRSMEAKRNKMKRMKRLAPRNLYSDYIPVGSGPNRLVLGEYRSRTLSLAFDDKYLAELEAKAKFKGVPAGRVEVRERLTELQGEGYTYKIGYAIISNAYQKCMLFKNSDGTAFKLCHEDYRKKIVRWSIEYGSKERALRAWHMDKVTWIEKKELSS